jgi:two-component sensor histidine kinase
MSFRQLILFLLLLVYALTPGHLHAGDTLRLSDVEQELTLWSSGKGRYLPSLSSDPEVVMASSDWKPFTGIPEKIESGYYWIQLTVLNDSNQPDYADFVALSSDSILLYTLTDEGIALEQITGPFVKPKEWVFPEYPEIVYLEIPAGAARSVLIRVGAHRGLPFGLDRFYVQPRQASLEAVVHGYRAFSARTEFNGFFLGAVLLMMLFFAFLYTRIRDKSLLFYSLYLLGAAVYALVVRSLPYSQLARIAYLDFELTYKLGEPIQYLFFAAYAWFAKHLLDIDARYGRLYRMLCILASTLTIAGIVLLIVNFTSFNYAFQEKAYIMVRILLLPTSILLVTWLGLSVKSPLKWFFVAGSSFFIVGGLIAFLMDPKSRHLFFGDTYINPIVAFKSGILLEGLCFALALGFKLRLIQTENEKANSALIKQMELNRQLIATENERLEKMVDERTQEVLQKNNLLETQKQQQLKSDYEKQLAEMEMQALRSQMNPHFIFNSLNSIRHQILTGKHENASTYLMRFAKLLRQILQNSRDHAIPLSEEIELIVLYLQLEQLRFGDLFEYQLEISPDIDTEAIMIPSMLLQPYVENALKHGIAESSRLPRRIHIRIEETQQGFRYEIEDNGIGRLAAEKKNALRDRPGLGLKITNERIMLFNNSYNQHIEVTFVDLIDPDQKPIGTRVVIDQLYESSINSYDY